MAIYLINTLMHPEGSEESELTAAEARAEEVLDVLVSLRDAAQTP